MIILGINAYHGDASAALIQNGNLIAAVEEERFNRIKHWAGFPIESIKFVLSKSSVSIEEIDHVAISCNPKANLGRKAIFALKNRPSFRTLLDRLQRQGEALSVKHQLARACGADESKVRAEFHNIEHHDAHLACGFLLSPFNSAAILSIDGMGDFVSTVSAIGDGAKINKLEEVFYPHSLGYLYNAITIYLGFPNYGDEYKVMGLAPYGRPEYINEFHQIVYAKENMFELNLNYFKHPKFGVRMSWDGGSPHVDAFHSDLLVERLGLERAPQEEITKKHEDIASSLQLVTEEIVFHMLNKLYEKTSQDNLVLVGGCSMNSVLNGKITRMTPFKNLYVPVGAADNGTSIGAAYHVWNIMGKNQRFYQGNNAFLGDELDNAESRRACESLIDQMEDKESEERKCGMKPNLSLKSLAEEDLFVFIVDAICAGKVVGWVQGRMEFGARALGNRSILADPRRADMRDIINLKIKFREKFRPFAPSILEECISEYFEVDECSPFMERVLPIRPDKRSLIPAVTHVDGTGRLQSVSYKTSPLYWKLIDRFRQTTGIPILLNTSLNENEPIVRTAEEAVSCFMRTSMDIIVLGNNLVVRN